MRGFAFGPGTAPRLFAYMLLGLRRPGLALIGLFTDGPPEEIRVLRPARRGRADRGADPDHLLLEPDRPLVPGLPPDVVVAALGADRRPAFAFRDALRAARPLFITAATLIFAVTVRPLGLVFASFVSLVVSAYATDEIRWIETIIWAAVLTISARCCSHMGSTCRSSSGRGSRGRTMDLIHNLAQGFGVVFQFVDLKIWVPYLTIPSR